jgi:hypothetical protein
MYFCIAYCGYKGCKNGGSCIAAFTCRCTPGWTGNTCQNGKFGSTFSCYGGTGCVFKFNTECECDINK